jgi:hypothetical protein
MIFLRRYVDTVSVAGFHYMFKEGILMDYNNIKKNPGLRALAKLMLNSF